MGAGGKTDSAGRSRTASKDVFRQGVFPQALSRQNNILTSQPYMKQSVKRRTNIVNALTLFIATVGLYSAREH
jgi:hypothetical protein